MITSPLLIIVILGIIEALTEFLPISSGAHLRLAGQWMPLPSSLASLATVVLQLGAIGAVVVHFWPLLRQLLPWRHQKQGSIAPALTISHLIIGVLPTVIIGGLGYPWIKSHLSLPSTLFYGLLGGSLLLIAAERLPINQKTQLLSQLSYQQSLLIGCFQCLALWPGFSRSGATIAGAMLLGVNRSVAITFSFLLAIPTVMGASLLDLFKQWPSLQSADWQLLLAGTTAAFIGSLLIIRWALCLLSRTTLMPFAIYRFLLAMLLA